MSKLFVISLALAVVACAPKPELERSSTTFTDPGVKVAAKEPVIASALDLTEYDSADGLNLDTKLKCVEDVCGQLPARSAADDSVAHQNAEMLMKALRPQLQSIVDDDAGATKATIAKIVASADALRTLKLEPRYVAFLNYQWAWARAEAVEPAWNESTRKYDDDRFAQLIAKTNVAPEHYDLIKQLLTAIKGTQEVAAANSIEQMGLDDYFSKVAHGDPHENEKKAALSVIERIKGINKAFPALPLKPSKATLALSRGEPIDKADEASFVANLHAISYDHIWTDELALFTSRQPNLATQIDGYLKTTKPVLEKLLDETRLSVAREKNEHLCMSAALGIARLKGHESAAAAAIQPVIDAVRTKVLVVADAMTKDTNAQAEVNRRVMATKFALPQSADLVLERINDDLSDARDAIAQQKAIVESGSLQDLMTWIALVNRQPNTNAAAPGGLCAQRSPTLIIDHAAPMYGVITLSWPTLLNPNEAYGVIAHEFGHVVSNAFWDIKSANDNYDPSIYSSAYNCVNIRASAKDPESTQEEDFADLFSSKVVNQIAASGTHIRNDICLLMKDDERWGASHGLAMRYPKGKADVHSPILYRLIQTEIDRGHHLPVACAMLVDQSPTPSMVAQCPLY